MIELEAHERGTLIPVRASAGARENAIRGEQNGALKVSVTQAPEKGKANKAIIRVLSKELGLKKSQIQLFSGETSRQKKFYAEGVSVEEVRGKVETVLNIGK